jgi:hypothetical protein
MSTEKNKKKYRASFMSNKDANLMGFLRFLEPSRIGIMFPAGAELLVKGTITAFLGATFAGFTAHFTHHGGRLANWIISLFSHN